MFLQRSKKLTHDLLSEYSLCLFYDCFHTSQKAIMLTNTALKKLKVPKLIQIWINIFHQVSFCNLKWYTARIAPGNRCLLGINRALKFKQLFRKVKKWSIKQWSERLSHIETKQRLAEGNMRSERMEKQVLLVDFRPSQGGKIRTNQDLKALYGKADILAFIFIKLCQFRWLGHVEWIALRECQISYSMAHQVVPGTRDLDLMDRWCQTRSKRQGYSLLKTIDVQSRWMKRKPCQRPR